ncbi:MAG TPA: APC family permease [Rhabdochlamydiaceae bacterium]
MSKKISLFALVLLVVGAIDSIRNLPASALFGSSLIFFFVFSAIVFLIPIALVSAELSAAFPTKGGVYEWVRTAFGEKAGMFSIWLQWINTMVWYPTILSFIAGTAAYIIKPELAQNKGYLVAVTLLTFWILTWVNLKGIEFSAKVNGICVLIGTMFPMLFLVALGGIWITSGMPLAIKFDSASIFPSLDNATNWISLTAIMASFLGMELSGVHVNSIHNPQRNFPKAMAYSALFILFSMLFGSLAIAFVIPTHEIRLVDGVMQVFTDFFQSFHMPWFIPILTLLIVVGSVGGMINWLIAPAKGLLHAAEWKFLPPFFSKLNRHGVPKNLLLVQATLVSLFCLAFLLVPSINSFYWFLTGLSTELYMMMYVMIFLSALRLHYTHKIRTKVFKIPGNHVGMWMTILLGLFGCTVTLIIGFFPPDELHLDGLTYALMILLGCVVMVLPVLFFYWYHGKAKRVKRT